MVVDQKLMVFDVGKIAGGTTIYLLNMTNGSLQSELVSTPPGLAYLPRTWLDNKRVLLVGFTQNADAPPQNVYLLDTTKGANQQATDFQQVVSLGNHAGTSIAALIARNCLLASAHLASRRLQLRWCATSNRGHAEYILHNFDSCHQHCSCDRPKQYVVRNSKQYGTRSEW